MAATLFSYAIEPQIMIVNVLMLANSSADIEMEGLPTELSLRIAKHLSHRDLKALALTSRHIVGVAQTILLSSVDVSGSHQDLRSFHASVVSRPAYFGPMVRRLRFYYYFDQGRLDFHELRGLLRSLPNLRCLHIDVEHYFLFTGNYDRLSDAISNIAGQLTHLQIGRSTNPLKLASTLRRLNTITDLSLDVRSCITDTRDYYHVNNLPIFLNALSAMSALVRLYIRGPPQFGATFPLKNLLPFAICDILPHTPHLRQLVLHERSRDRGPPPFILLESSSLAQHVSLPTTLDSITWIDHDTQLRSSTLPPNSANTVRTLFALIPSLTRVDHHERGYRYVFRRIDNGVDQKTIERRSERLDGISLDKRLGAYARLEWVEWDL